MMIYQARKVYQKEDIASHYDEERFLSIRGRLTDRLEKSLIYRALAHAGLKPPSKIIDVPCGTGRLSISLSQQGYQVTGVDLSPAMIQQAQAKNFNTANLRFELGDAEALSFDDRSFDAVVSLRFLGHVPPPVRYQVLKEFRRVSSRWLILAYYQRYCLQGMIRQGRRQRPQQMWHPVTRGEIKAELAAHDLNAIRYWSLIPFISETMVILVERNSRR